MNRLPIAALALLVLIVVPVSADGVQTLLPPPTTLHRGDQTSYLLSVYISFNQSCQPILSSTVSPGIVCPMIPMISPSLNINGTLGWTVTGLNATTVMLNVTRDIMPSSGESVAAITHHTASFNESINLATRIASILPFIEPEMDQALQEAQTNMATSMPAGTDWGSTMSGIAVTMIRQPLHTMWWVNGPLKVNDSIPVLLFPTNVTGSTSVDIGGTVGRRSAWTLVFNPASSLLSQGLLAATTPSIPTAHNLEFALTFNYDQTSDLLLSASADIHLGFGEETFIQPTPCDSSATTAPAANVYPLNSVPMIREFGIDLQASLKLTSTSVDLSQPLTCVHCLSHVSVGSTAVVTGITVPLAAGNGNGQGSGPGTGPSSNSGPGQPSGNPKQSKPVQLASLLPWLYGILGMIAAAIVASGIWVGRRRMRKTSSLIPTNQSSV